MWGLRKEIFLKEMGQVNKLVIGSTTNDSLRLWIAISKRQNA